MKSWKLKKRLFQLGCLLAGLVIGVSFLSIRRGSAVTGSQWRADRIIDDANFYNGSAMSESAIQNFLNAKVPTCDTNHTKSSNPNDSGPPYTCLKNYTTDTPNRVADSYCSGTYPGGIRSAANIIYEVARVCNISPKVILITLQKEQSLVTDTWPWTIQYTKATGYGCPDSSLPASVDANDNGCYDQYEGFFNQVYYAARQFQRYKIDANLFNHRVGQTSRVYYHPNSSCGYTNITMYNHATAGLYNYTPYQPNQAALNDLYGSGDIADPDPPNCSSFGNRNFWRMYWDWFGDPRADMSTAVAFSGDWDGDGDDTIGVKHGNQYFIDNNNDGFLETSFSYGSGNEIPLIGDWDGDGDDTVSLRVGHKVFINNELDSYSDFAYSYGVGTEGLLVGDWDADGDDSVSLRVRHKIFINRALDSYSDFAYPYYADPAQIAVVGDWDGNGVDTVSMRVRHKFFINNGFDEQSDFAYAYGYGSPTDTPLPGDFDNDNQDTIGLKINNKIFFNNDFDGTSDSLIIISF